MIDKNMIMELIDLKHEGGYWDFKKEWHDKNEELLFDIICFANNLENRDCYIIFGVDEHKDYQIADVTTDSNRKDTSNVINFLETIPFCGNLRPDVIVDSIEIDDKTIDVLTIKNSFNTPYFLSERYKHGKGVLPYIFVRLKNSNSLRDRNADINHIETLWKKRFRMDQSPLERIKYLLSDYKNWDNSPVKDIDLTKKYYKYAPEYTIEETMDDRDGVEVMHLLQCDNTPHWGTIELKYHQTVLGSVDLAILDGGRYTTAAPTFGYIEIDYENYYYRYYQKGKLNAIMYNYYLMKENLDNNASGRLLDCVIFFESEEDRINFEKYVVINKETFIEKIKNVKDRFETVQLRKDLLKSEFEKRYKMIVALKSMYEEYKNLNN